MEIDPQLHEGEFKLSSDRSMSSPLDTRLNDDTPKILSRNSACHACRKRKLKCDAKRPVCSNCQKHRTRGTKAPDDVQAEDCTWDEIKEPSARTKRRRELAVRQARGGIDSSSSKVELHLAKKAKLNELEGRIAAFEGAIDLRRQLTSSPSSSLVETPLSQQSDHESYVSQLQPNATVPSPSFSLGGSRGYHGRLPLVSGSECMARVDEDAVVDDVVDNDKLTERSRPVPPVGNFVPVGQLSREESLETPSEGQGGLIRSDWPRDLPPPAAVDHAVRVFFEKVPILPKMLNKNIFLQSLHQSPLSSSFPCTSLVHAILSVSANFISETSLSSRSYYPTGTPFSCVTHPEYDFEPPQNVLFRGGSASQHYMNTTFKASNTPMAVFQLWHRRKAFETFYNYVDRGDKFLQCLQGQIIATSVDQYNAWWTDVWLEVGTCVRIAIPMRINESPHLPESSLRRHTNLLMPPAQSALEQAERDRTWWMTFILERTVTANTTWPSSLSDEEITVELPCLQSVYEQGYGDLIGSQTLQSFDLMTNHPLEHQDSLCFLIKALKILSDVNVFFRKYSRGRHTISDYVSSPAFRILLSQVNTFRLSFPIGFRRPIHDSRQKDNANVDRELILALWITHSAIMGLGEPLVTKNTWMDEGARVTLSAIRATLSLLYDVIATSYDLTLFPAQCATVWCLSSRGLIRFMTTAAQSGDMVSASVFRSEIEVFRMALKTYGERFPIGTRNLQVVDDLLDEAEHRSGELTYSIRYDCSKEHVLKFGRHVGASISEETTPVSIVTPQPVTAAGQCNAPSGSEQRQAPAWCLFSSLSENPLQDLADLTSSARDTSCGGSSRRDLPDSSEKGYCPISPAFLSNPLPASGWDITSFSFDVNSMMGFEKEEVTFEGSSYGLGIPS